MSSEVGSWKKTLAVCECLTVHLRLDELDEGLCEGQNPFVHDVVTLLRCVFLVQELNIILLTHQYTSTHTKTQLNEALTQITLLSLL